MRFTCPVTRKLELTFGRLQFIVVGGGGQVSFLQSSPVSGYESAFLAFAISRTSKTSLTLSIGRLRCCWDSGGHCLCIPEGQSQPVTDQGFQTSARSVRKCHVTLAGNRPQCEKRTI
jgi:hypothetical protein